HAKQDNAQEPNQNFKPGYRLDPTRDYDGRFAQVDDSKLVRDVASFKSRKDILAKFGDRTVAELRAMFGGLSVSKIRAMTLAARGAIFGAAGVGAGNAAVGAAVIGAV